MKPVIFLRIAAVLTFIHSALHTFGGVFGAISPGPATAAVAAMKANQFMAMGSLRTYWDFEMGMGLIVTVFLTMESFVFWFLASRARNHANELRPLLIIFAIGYLAVSVVAYNYFFIGPVIVEIVIALCLIAAAITARSSAVTSRLAGTNATG